MYTSLPWVRPASTAAWNFAVESVLPVGSAPKSPTTSRAPEGLPTGAPTCSKSARSIVKEGEAAVEVTWSRTFVPAASVDPNIVRVSS